jgi:hypothetical protein
MTLNTLFCSPDVNILATLYHGYTLYAGRYSLCILYAHQNHSLIILQATY